MRVYALKLIQFVGIRHILASARKLSFGHEHGVNNLHGGERHFVSE